MASITPDGSVLGRKVDVVGRYYRAFFSDPVLRAWYGDSGYANLGLWDEGVDDARAAGDALVDALIERVPGGLRGAVLDVACGHGGSTARLGRHVDPAHVTAIGVSSEQLSAARARARRSNFVQMDAAGLGFADASFDVVLCVEAAFHFDTRSRFLAEAYRVLNPGGRLALSDLLMNEGTPLIPRMNHLPGSAAYAALLKRHGFVDVRIEDVTRRTWRAYRKRLTAFVCARTDRWRSMVGVRDLLAANAALAWAIRGCVLVSAGKPALRCA